MAFLRRLGALGKNAILLHIPYCLRLMLKGLKPWQVGISSM